MRGLFLSSLVVFVSFAWPSSAQFLLYPLSAPSIKPKKRKKRAPVRRGALKEEEKRNQPLTAPAVTPSMNCLCARKNTTSDGMMEIRETAMTRFHAKPVSASMLMRTNSVAG